MAVRTQIKEVPPTFIISRRDRVTVPQIPAHSEPAFESLFAAMKALGISPAGPPIYIYHDFDGDPATPFDLEIGFPIAHISARPAAPIGVRWTDAYRCIATDYAGSMLGIGDAWKQFVETAQQSGNELTGESREIYKQWVDFDSAENVTELQQGIA